MKKRSKTDNMESRGAEETAAEVTAEPQAKTGGEEKPKKKLTRRELEERLAEAEEDAAAYRERLMRLQAEFENFRRRQSRDRDEQRRSAKERVVREFLPALDNLGRALEHGDGADQGKLLEGVELVFKQFSESFAQLGLEQIESLGECFDPHVHEAMSRVETDGDPPDGTVVEVYQKGYLMDGRVLRPAMVGVAKIVDAAEGVEEE
jgi:molecular chaperone GrpE